MFFLLTTIISWGIAIPGLAYLAYLGVIGDPRIILPGQEFFWVKYSMYISMILFGVTLFAYPLLVYYGFCPVNYDQAEKIVKAKAVIALSIVVSPAVTFFVVGAVGSGAKLIHGIIMLLIFFVPFVNALFNYNRLKDRVN